MEKASLGLIDFESYYYITRSRERLNGLSNYLSIMDRQVAGIEAEQAEQLKKDLETLPDSWSDIDRISFTQWREHEYEQFNNTFAENFRYSFIVLVWLIIEDELKGVCIEVQRRNGLVPKKWKGKGVIDQCKEILSEVAGITFQNITNWSSICDLQKIRDCIVHTSGFVDKSRDKHYLTKLVEEGRLDIQIDDYDSRLRISTEYCKLAVQYTTEFLTAILDGARIKIWKASE